MSKNIKYLETIDLSSMYMEEKIDYLIKQNKELQFLMELYLPDLTTKKGVIHFLEITTNTFNTYIKESRLVEGVHYYKEKEELVFVKDEIINFKKSGQVGRKINSKKDNTLEEIQQELNIMSSSRSASKGAFHEC